MRARSSYSKLLFALPRHFKAGDTSCAIPGSYFLISVSSSVLRGGEYAALARTLIVRPESCTILYAGDTFTVRQTFFVPVREQGAVILLDVETEQPLEIEASFHRDFQLEWPAALGATYLNWAGPQRAF